MNFIPTKFTSGASSHSFSIFDLIRKLEKGYINKDPDYQRGEVWPENAKPKLIQSIFGGILLPPLMFNKNGNTKFVVIDGKQRLTAMSEFVNNEFCFYNEDEPKKKIYFKSLDREYQEEFKNTQVSVYIYNDLSESQQRELFERVNFGQNLTWGEKIKGLNMPDWELDILKSTVRDIGPNLDILFGENKRESHYECLGVFIALEIEEYQNASKGKKSLTMIKNLEGKLEGDKKKHLKKICCNIKNYTAILKNIHADLIEYCEVRGYKFIKWKWSELSTFY